MGADDVSERCLVDVEEVWAERATLWDSADEFTGF